ncbi:MAG TPA: hypothetical protein VMG41_16190 [Gemmatimonadales bacterium]|nr:hypothetical protein [Gemmatimonadales bacterium]
MRRKPVLLLMALACGPARVSAQTPYPACNRPIVTASSDNINLCNAAVDGANVFQPVAGLLMSGGNAVLGSTHTLGGLGHFAITARVNATELKTPSLNYNGATDTVGSGSKIFAPAPLVEAAAGVLGGFGSSGFLSLDVLGSAQLLPTTQVKNLSVDPNARKIGSVALGLGYGARVGVIKGGSLIPAVTVSAMHRSIPRLTVGSLTSGDNYSFSTDLSVTNLRAVAGYKLAILDVGAGLGWDKYTSGTRILFKDQLVSQTDTVNLNLDNSRKLAFLTAGLDLPIIKIGAEVGYQLGKTETLKTVFIGNDPSASRLFAGAGVRFSF